MDSSVKVAIITGIFGILTYSLTLPPVQNIFINQPPVIHGLMPTPNSPQLDGTPITWTAIASDANNEDLFYKFQLMGLATRGVYKDQTNWSTQNEWIWHSNQSDIGPNHIRVSVKDGHNKMDNESNDYNITNKAMDDGKIIYSNIRKMNLSEPYPFRACIAMSDSIDAAKKDITKDTDVGERALLVSNNPLNDTGNTSTATKMVDKSVRVTPRMRVDLKGVDTDSKGDPLYFTISRLTPENLEIPLDRDLQGYGLWSWSVTPTKIGFHDINLIAYDVSGDTPMYVGSAEISIEVTDLTKEKAAVKAAVENKTAEAAGAAKEAASTEAKKQPGFEGVFAIAGLLAVAYLVLGRRS